MRKTPVVTVAMVVIPVIKSYLNEEQSILKFCTVTKDYKYIAVNSRTFTPVYIIT